MCVEVYARPNIGGAPGRLARYVELWPRGYQLVSDRHADRLLAVAREQDRRERAIGFIGGHRQIGCRIQQRSRSTAPDHVRLPAAQASACRRGPAAACKRGHVGAGLLQQRPQRRKHGCVRRAARYTAQAAGDRRAHPAAAAQAPAPAAQAAASDQPAQAGRATMAKCSHMNLRPRRRAAIKRRTRAVDLRAALPLRARAAGRPPISAIRWCDQQSAQRQRMHRRRRQIDRQRHPAAAQPPPVATIHRHPAKIACDRQEHTSFGAQSGRIAARLRQLCAERDRSSPDRAASAPAPGSSAHLGAPAVCDHTRARS